MGNRRRTRHGVINSGSWKVVATRFNPVTPAKAGAQK